MDLEIDLRADLNAEDDDGNGWSLMRDARKVSRIVPGAMVLAGNEQARAVVRVLHVDGGGRSQPRRPARSGAGTDPFDGADGRQRRA